jgi:nucleotide-binding universal stress UspA family protein
VIRIILAAIDNSPRAPGVLATARDIAARFGARVHVFRAVYVPPDIPAGAPSDDDRGGALMRARAERELRATVADAPGVVVEPPELSDEPPWRSILAVADRLDVDLVVIGSHGYRGIDRILGTTAARVVNLSNRSVLVVHERTAVPEAPRGA